MPSNEGMASLKELRAKARKQMDEAIENLPAERKADYLMALEKAPYLFENETDPLMFLRVCDYNHWEAAERIVLYWKERTELFGPDRAYLPLVLTGDGALNDDDILSIKAGFPNRLPNSKSGHPVIFTDRRLHLPHLTAQNRLRGVFYMSHKLAEEEEITQSEGFIMLTTVVTPRLHEVDSYFLKKSADLAYNVMPVKFHQIHFLSCPPKQKNGMEKRHMVQDVIRSFCDCFLAPHAKCKIELHFDRGGGEVFDALVNEVGLVPCSIPREFGGTWDQTQCIVWCRQQISIEREKYKWVLRAAKKRAITEEPLEEHKAEAKDVHKKRAVNACNSRLKRARKRDYVENLKTQHGALAMEQEALKEEHLRLQSLLKQAEDLGFV